MRVPYLPSIVIAVGLLINGCATVTRGTTEPLAIQSEPTGTEVELSTGQRCVTPCNLELKRKHDYRLTLHKEGFEDVVVAVQPRVAGAAMRLGPDPVRVHLAVRNPADADRLCGPPDRVAGAICRGQLRAGVRI